jgi:hypothetical protein
MVEMDSRWKLVERVVAAPGFAKSQRLSTLLQHVVKQSLQGKEEELNEQLIGERVFGRPVGYDPRDDNIVRAHASRLRQKLDTYFREEGRDEPLRVAIPRGSYVPVFERVDLSSIPATESESPPAAPATVPLQREPRFPHSFPKLWVRFAGWIACLAAIVCFLYFAEGRSSVQARDQSPLHTLWSAIFSQNRDTLIVPADSSLIILKSFSRHAISVADYASGKYLSDVNCEEPCDRRLLATLVEHRYTSLADLQFAVALSHLPEALPNRTRIRYARDLQLDDLKQSSLILIGSLEADPWLQFFQNQMNFVLHDDRLDGPLGVENKKPRAGEQASYPYSRDDPAHRGYALVAFLPNLSGSGNVLVVQGFTLAGTQAATEFVTNAYDFDSLFGPIIRKRHGLPHFEVLLRTMDVNGLGARPSVVAYHVY